MGSLVCNGATCQCTFGAAPSTLFFTPDIKVFGCNLPVATIKDNVPMVNIMPFGMCSSPTNPQVQAATAAAFGVFTPAPCVPATSAPWAPVSTVMIANKPALNNLSKLTCSWAGVISITNPGQTTIQVP